MSKISHYERMPIGVVGCGYAFDRLHLNALRTSPDWQLVAACDSDEGKLAVLKRIFPELACYSSIDDLLDARKIKALLIATPTASHAQLVLRALDADLHVLVEKPLATDPEDAARIVTASAKHARVVQVGFNRRFRKTIGTLKHTVTQHQPGAIRSLRYVFMSEAKRWNAAGDLARTDERQLNADMLHDVASHQMDLIAWLTAQPVTSVRVDHVGGVDGERTIRFSLKGSAGLHTDCMSAWTTQYRESVRVSLPDGYVVAYPESVIGPTKLAYPPARLLGSLKGRVAQAARRISGSYSLTQQSIQDQLTAFAARVRSKGGADDGPLGGADVHDAADTVAAVSACVKGCDNLGVWMQVPRRIWA